MKKTKRKAVEPSAASVRAVPSVDFAGLKPGRKNPFARRMAKEGWELVHEGPSAASLREVPELSANAKGRPNPYAKRIRAQGIELAVGKGRPHRGSEVGPTVVKSVRLPPKVWEALEARAAEEGIALHALVRAALLEWLARNAA